MTWSLFQGWIPALVKCGHFLHYTLRSNRRPKHYSQAQNHFCNSWGEWQGQMSLESSSGLCHSWQNIANSAEKKSRMWVRKYYTALLSLLEQTSKFARLWESICYIYAARKLGNWPQLEIHARIEVESERSNFFPDSVLFFLGQVSPKVFFLCFSWTKYFGMRELKSKTGRKLDQGRTLYSIGDARSL